MDEWNSGNCYVYCCLTVVSTTSVLGRSWFCFVCYWYYIKADRDIEPQTLCYCLYCRSWHRVQNTFKLIIFILKIIRYYIIILYPNILCENEVIFCLVFWGHFHKVSWRITHIFWSYFFPRHLFLKRCYLSPLNVCIFLRLLQTNNHQVYFRICCCK